MGLKNQRNEMCFKLLNTEVRCVGGAVPSQLPPRFGDNQQRSTCPLSARGGDKDGAGQSGRLGKHSEDI